MSANAERALAHYTGELAKLDAPAPRLTIELLAMDEGVDLTTVTFEHRPHSKFGHARACRFVMQADASGRTRAVGLWRVVPEANVDG